LVRRSPTETNPPAWERLRPHLGLDGPGLVALSGGADSSVLLGALIRAGQEVTAATFASPLHPGGELEAAKRLTARLGVAHVVIPEKPLADPDFAANPPERCYLCKKRRLDALGRLSRERGLAFCLAGTLASDLAAYRPGLKASAEAGALTPLAAAGFDKDDVFALGRWLGLEEWLQPASACLASRVVYHQPLTAELLDAISRAEELVCRVAGAALGAIRVRVHGRLARIELEPEALPALLEPAGRVEVADGLRRLGFVYVTVDLAGFSSGSMDRLLKEAADGPL